MVILTEDPNDALYQKPYLSPGILLLLVSHYQCSYVYHRLEACRLQSMTKIMGKAAIWRISCFYPILPLTMLRNIEQNLLQAMLWVCNIFKQTF